MKLAFGLMRLPKIDNDDSKIDIEKFKEMVDEFISAGGTYFDTAYVYHKGESERAFKKAITERYPRDAYTITDKMPMFALKQKEDLERIFNEQLEKTGVSYFDYYWLHALNRNYMTRVDEYDAFGFIKQKQAEGKIKHIGFSYHDDAQLLDDILTKHPNIEFVQLQLNYLDWLSDSVQSKACYDVCVKHNKKVIVMEPVKGGSLVKLPDDADKLFKDADSNMSNASWAIRFAASLENVYMVLSGMTTIEQLKDNLSYMKDFKPLTNQEHNMCLEVAEIIKKVSIIPCTGCEYCTSVCPIGMPIPKLFALYNLDKQVVDTNKQDNNYEELKNAGPRVDKCLDCGACENICPQHLSIRKYLKEVKKHFEGE